MSAQPLLRNLLAAFIGTAAISSVNAQDEHQHQRAAAQTESAALADRASEHVPPDPPQTQLEHVSYQDMVEMMQMDDRARYGRIQFDRAEWRNLGRKDSVATEARAHYGGDYHKLLVRAELEREDDAQHGEAELLWDRVIARWWTLQAGVRRDFGDGPSRTWAAVGIEGLAPYWFDVEATLLLGKSGRSALDVEVEYELLLSQRWILRPRIEARLYGKDDRELNVGSGLSEAELGMRLHYEIRRELAPYVGVVWIRAFGETAKLVSDRSEVGVVAGLRFWF